MDTLITAEPKNHKFNLYYIADQFYIFINFEEVKDNLVEKIRIKNELKCTCSQNCKNNSNYHKCGCKCHKKITKKVRNIE